MELGSQNLAFILHLSVFPHLRARNLAELLKKSPLACCPNNYIGTELYSKFHACKLT